MCKKHLSLINICIKRRSETIKMLTNALLFYSCSRCRSALNRSNESVYSDDIEDLQRNDSDEDVMGKSKGSTSYILYSTFLHSVM